MSTEWARDADQSEWGEVAQTKWESDACNTGGYIIFRDGGFEEEKTQSLKTIIANQDQKLDELNKELLNTKDRYIVSLNDQITHLKGQIKEQKTALKNQIELAVIKEKRYSEIMAENRNLKRTGYIIGVAALIGGIYTFFEQSQKK